MVRDLLLIKFGQLLIKEMFFLNKKKQRNWLQESNWKVEFNSRTGPLDEWYENPKFDSD